MLHGELHKRIIEVLCNIPITETPEGRDTLLEGLPQSLQRGGLNRYSQRYIDLSKLVTQLDNLGRLVETGISPLIVLLENAQQTVAGTSTGRTLKDIIHELERLDEAQDATRLPSSSVPLLKQEIPEALVFGGNDERLPLEFFERAMLVQQSVARLQVPRIFGNVSSRQVAYGTGWLIAPGLLCTNHHVIAARRSGEAAADSDFQTQALRTYIWFDYHSENGSRTEYRSGELVYANSEFDCAFIRLAQGQQESSIQRSHLTINPYASLQQGDRLNIVQYPGGHTLKYAIRNNFYVENSDNSRYIRYVTDTEHGSSGSPIFNDDWYVVGIHCATHEIQPTHYKGEMIRYHNMGIEIQTILSHLPSALYQEIVTGQGW